MPIFNYTAIDESGSQIKGSRSAQSVSHLLELLEQQQLSALEIKEQKVAQSKKQKSVFSASERLLLFKQLHSMIKAGFTFKQALDQCSRTMKKENQQFVVLDIIERLEQGQSLYSASKEHQRHLGADFCELMNVVQQSGKAEHVLESLCEQKEQQQELFSKLLSAMMYPGIVALLSIFMMFFLLIYVVPQMTQVLTKSGQKLPLLTEIMLGLSGFLQSNFIYLIFGLISLMVLIVYALKNSTIKLLLDGKILNFPILGSILIDYYTIVFCKNLSVLTSSGIPLLEALRFVAPVVSNTFLSNHVQQASERISKGVNFSKALQVPGTFNPILEQFLMIANNTGNLPYMLDQVGNHLQTFLIRRTLRLATIMEPLLIVLMGGAVMVIVLSVLLPIIKMNQMPI